MWDFSKINQFAKKRGNIICVCGDSGSGKSTYVKNHIQDGDVVLDGDGVRYYINEDLGYSYDDRKSNNERIAKIANYIASQGFNVFISTVRADIAYDYLRNKGIIEIVLIRL